MIRYRNRGRCAAIAIAALALLLAAAPAGALTPAGSYLQSCTNIRAYAGRVVADCRRVDGAWSRSAISDVDGCVGGIANSNGHLTCSRARRDYGAHRWDGYGSTGRSVDRAYDGR